VVLTQFSDASQKLVEQQSTTIETKNSLSTASQHVTELSEQKVGLTSSLKEERLKTDNLTEENQSLKVKLQAKKDAEIATQTKEVQIIVPDVTGNKADWLAQSGIPQSEWTYVDYIVSKESGWNPSAVNSSSGACGLGQQLPCGKWSGAWNDPVAALRAMDSYAKERYNSWAGAYSAWLSKNWW